MADIVLSFRGETFTIPDSRAFEVGAAVEEVASFYEVLGWQREPRFFKMARCIGIMLRAAGAKATDREVHAELMESVTSAGTNRYLFSALLGLLHVLMDGAPPVQGQPEGEPVAS